MTEGVFSRKLSYEQARDIIASAISREMRPRAEEWARRAGMPLDSIEQIKHNLYQDPVIKAEVHETIAKRHPEEWAQMVLLHRPIVTE